MLFDLLRERAMLLGRRAGGRPPGALRAHGRALRARRVRLLSTGGIGYFRLSANQPLANQMFIVKFMFLPTALSC